MNHLTDSQINEILDRTPGASDQSLLDAHLSECMDCRNKVEALRSLFQALADVPDEALTHDLAPRVINLLPQIKIPFVWKLVMAVQLGIAIGTGIPIATNLLSLVKLPNIYSLLVLKFPPFQLPVINFHLPVMNIQASTTNLVFLGISALVLWGVGNAALLRGRKEARK